MRLLKLMLLLSGLLAAHDGHATSCAHRSMDSDESQRMFGPAVQVFIGSLQRVVEQPRRLAAKQKTCEGDCPMPLVEAIDLLTMQGFPDTVGEFLVEQVYKGEDAPIVMVRGPLHQAQTGRYLVYAYADVEAGGELYARAGCGSSMFPLGSHFDGLLTHLDALPAPGLGGRLKVQTHFEHPRRPWADASLRLVGEAGEFTLETDAEGAASAAAIPAGSYRFDAVAPEGLVLACSTATTSCDTVEISDGGLVDLHVLVRAPAELTIRLLDAGGNAVGALAQFEILDADTGEARAWHVVSRSVSENGSGQTGRLMPGRVVVALVLSKVQREGWATVVSDRRHVLSGGTPLVRDALPINVVAGANTFTFVLTPELQPVRTTLVHAGPTSLGSIVTLLGGADLGGPADSNYVHLDAQKSFWSIPGQSFGVMVYPGRLANTPDGMQLIMPRHTGTVMLAVEAAGAARPK